MTNRTTSTMEELRPAPGRAPMPSSPPSPARALAALVLLALLAADAEAQRGGRGGGRRQGGINVLLPKPVAPVDSDPFAALPPAKPVRSGAVPRGGFLPPPVEGELPEIPSFDVDTSDFAWRDPHDPELVSYYFESCDRDGNEWISFREARVSLEVNRKAYAIYDRDRDGRIRREEFSTRYAEVVERLGNFPPPITAAGTASEPAAVDPVEDQRVAALLERFDSDGDLILARAELDAIIAEIGLPVTEVNPDVIFAAVDNDYSESLGSPREISLLLVLLEYGMDVYGIEKTRLFGGPNDAPNEEETSSRRIARPTPHFARLDQDGDGYVTHEDLAAVQSPIHLSVRTNAVVASLDADGDGRLSRDEFYAAFR